MTKLLLRFPWFISTPTLIALAAALAFGANLMVSDYFERSFLDEVNPLAASGIPTATVATPLLAPSPTVPASDSTLPLPTSEVEAATPEPTLSPEPTAALSQPGVIASGTFRDGAPGHNGSGTATLLRDENGQLFLRFEDFSVTNGPDLFVYLTTGGDSNVEAGLNLGSNKATDGNINYEIPPSIDVSQYDSVVIWCDAANVTFAVATLEVS